MTEGGESALFKHLFKSWTDKGQTQGLGTTYSVGKIGKAPVWIRYIFKNKMYNILKAGGYYYKNICNNIYNTLNMFFFISYSL